MGVHHSDQCVSGAGGCLYVTPFLLKQIVMSSGAKSGM